MKILGFDIRRVASDKELPHNSETSGGTFYYSPSMSIGELLSNTTVSSCVGIISDAVATLPCVEYQRTGDGRRKAETTRLYSLLKYGPNADDTPYTFFQQVVMHLLLRGNAFIFTSRGGLHNPEVQSLSALDPDSVEIKRDSETSEVYYVYTCNGIQHKFTSDYIIHIPAIRYNRLRGLSPIEYAAHAARLGLRLDEYTDDYFQSGVHSKILLEIPQEYKNWTEDDSKKLSDRFIKQYGGRDKANKPLIMNKGMKATSVNIAGNGESQLVENRSFSEKEVAKIFRVPLFMLGKDDAKFTNTEQLNTYFLQHTLTPWLVRIQQYLSRAIPVYDRLSCYIEFDTNAMMRADLRSRMDAYVKGMTNGIYSPNDIRMKENMELLPEEEGGKPFIPVNLMQLTKENLDAYMAQQKIALQGKGKGEEK